VDETGNAGGMTSYWGYEAPGQVNPGSPASISFQGTQNTDLGSGYSEKDSSAQLGFDMAYGGVLKRWWRKRLGWEVGVGILPLNFKDRRSLEGVATTATDIYSLPVGLHGDIVVPGAPYHGGPSGVGVQLLTDPISQEQTTSPATITGTRQLDLMFYNVRLGPTFYYDMHPRWAVSLSAGAAMGVVTGDYLFDENITSSAGVTHIAGKFGKTDMVYGGYANALALVHILENGDIFAGVQVMPMTSLSFANGGRAAKLNLGKGVYFTAGVSWPF
jgi:hypothetical protein